jgi:hypothetical protein
MNRLVVLAFVLALSPLAAVAQNETITVTDESLVGPWRIGMPLWHFFKSDKLANFGPMRDAYCRVGGKRDDLHVYCLQAWTPLRTDEGDMSLHGDAIHICWCDFFGRDTIDATQKSPGVFSGSLVTNIIGFPVNRVPGVSIASKIVVSNNTPDVGGKSAVLAKLLADIAGGAPLSSLVQLPYKLPDSAPPPTSKELRGLGAIQLVTYLGHTATPDEYAAAGWTRMPPDRAFLMQVYDVEFANGERVCELSTREDGVVNGLVCA